MYMGFRDRWHIWQQKIKMKTHTNWCSTFDEKRKKQGFAVFSSVSRVLLLLKILDDYH